MLFGRKASRGGLRQQSLVSRKVFRWLERRCSVPETRWMQYHLAFQSVYIHSGPGASEPHVTWSRLWNGNDPIIETSNSVIEMLIVCAIVFWTDRAAIMSTAVAVNVDVATDRSWLDTICCLAWTRHCSSSSLDCHKTVHQYGGSYFGKLCGCDVVRLRQCGFKREAIHGAAIPRYIGIARRFRTLWGISEITD